MKTMTLLLFLSFSFSGLAMIKCVDEDRLLSITAHVGKDTRFGKDRLIGVRVDLEDMVWLSQSMRDIMGEESEAYHPTQMGIFTIVDGYRYTTEDGSAPKSFFLKAVGEVGPGGANPTLYPVLFNAYRETIRRDGNMFKYDLLVTDLNFEGFNSRTGNGNNRMHMGWKLKCVDDFEYDDMYKSENNEG